MEWEEAHDLGDDFHPLLLGDKQLFERGWGQSQGHKGEGKKDEEYYCTFGNRANNVDQGRVMVTTKP
jgi:hypothetical protein